MEEPIPRTNSREVSTAAGSLSHARTIFIGGPLIHGARHVWSIQSGCGQPRKDEPMTTRTRPSITKRNREQARRHRQEEKAAKRSDRAAQKRDKPDSTEGVDPDLLGLVAGPQPSLGEPEEDEKKRTAARPEGPAPSKASMVKDDPVP
jgi:hypothetical protein